MLLLNNDIILTCKTIDKGLDMRGLLHGVLIVILNISPTLFLAQFAEEDAGETGVTNPRIFHGEPIRKL